MDSQEKMQDLKSLKANEYNQLPIKFCEHCLWIGDIDTVEMYNTAIDVCPCCGSTDFTEDFIENWDKAFKEKYKQGSYLNIKIEKYKGVRLWKKIMEKEPQMP